VGEIVRQLRAASAGEEPPPVETFEQRLLREVDTVWEAHRVSERAARLAEVAAALSRAATPEDVTAAVLEQGVAALGASGGGVLLAPREGLLQVSGTLGYDENVVARLRAESPDAELPAALALRTGEPVWLESREERDVRFPELRGLERGTVSMCAVPLVVGDHRLGALRFSFPAARLFDDQERRFVVTLAAQTAQALERAQLHTQRYELSSRLQRSLLPGRLPDIPGVDVAGVYHPLADAMELGGDFYDVWAMPGDRFAFAIGDATGSGPEAAALSAMVRFTLRALSDSGVSAEEVLAKLNRTMLESEAGGPFAERFCTAILGIVVPGERPRVILAGGGHPYPLVRRRGRPAEEAPLGGWLLGLFDDAEVGVTEVELGPGDVLVLVTDGATEARRQGRMFGVGGVLAAIDAVAPEATAGSVAEAVEAAVLAHTGGTLTDDLAVLALRAR
jgi:serine phosphatase RsbU (regulator of sigma subunit)